MTESIKVAVDSQEGLAISEHFGHAKRFHIYELNGTEVHFLEQRQVRQYCLGGSSDKSAMAEILETIADCDAVPIPAIVFMFIVGAVIPTPIV